MNSGGNYQSIYEYTPQGVDEPQWTISGEFSNLFPWNETSFVARQTHQYPHWVAGMDSLCRLTGTKAINEAVLEFASCPGGSPGDSLVVYQSLAMELPASFHFNDINDAASCRPLTFYDDALTVSFDEPGGGSVVYRSTSNIDFRSGNGISISLSEDDDYIDTLLTDIPPLLTSARVYSVRQPYRVPVVSNPDIPDYPDRIVLLNSDILAEDPYDFFANLHVALDTMFVCGIESTSRSNCLIHDLRCGGRRQDGQLTFYPSSDSLLYLMTTALVHGCRGFHLRSMDITAMSGNGGDSPSYGTYRFPSLLLNWGPGVETTNPDMIGRLFDVVQSLTGKNTSSPDFMSALIDSNFAMMDTVNVRNAVYTGTEWVQDLDNDSLNSIALEDTVSGDILLMAVNDFDEMFYDNKYIRFPDHYEDSFTVLSVNGFQCSEDTLRDETRVRFNFYGMPGYTASLYWLEYD